MNKNYNINWSTNNIHIEDSYKYVHIKDMKEVLMYIKSQNPTWPRSMFGMINEWRAHNFLYNIGIYKDRTRSVDLESNIKWYLNIGYFCLSLLYWHI